MSPRDDAGQPLPEGAATAAPPSLLDQLGALLAELPALFSDRIELLSLELQRAARVLAQVAALVVIVAILGVSAWFLLWGAAVAAMLHAGLSLAWTLSITLLVNLAGAALVALRIRRLLPQISLPATRRRLLMSPAPPAPEPSPESRP